MPIQPNLGLITRPKQLVCSQLLERAEGREDTTYQHPEAALETRALHVAMLATVLGQAIVCLIHLNVYTTITFIFIYLMRALQIASRVCGWQQCLIRAI
jgi:hypothetical protein